MQTFVDPDLPARLRVGPLASYLDAYLKHIEHSGFLPASVPMQMYAIARFSNWLHIRQLGVHQVDEALVGAIFETRSEYMPQRRIRPFTAASSD